MLIWCPEFFSMMWHLLWIVFIKVKMYKINSIICYEMQQYKMCEAVFFFYNRFNNSVLFSYMWSQRLQLHLCLPQLVMFSSSTELRLWSRISSDQSPRWPGNTQQLHGSQDLCNKNSTDTCLKARMNHGALNRRHNTSAHRQRAALHTLVMQHDHYEGMKLPGDVPTIIINYKQPVSDLFDETMTPIICSLLH